jgi:hypothetical protein
MPPSRYAVPRDPEQRPPLDSRRSSRPQMPSMPSAGNRYTPPMSPGDSPSRRVHWPDDPNDQHEPRGRTAERRLSGSSRSRTRSQSRSSSLDYLPPSDNAEKKDKPWFKKKTVWTTVASLATVAVLVPSTMSANASVEAASAATRAAKSTRRAAVAGESSARASYLSARAVNNTCIAQGHQDYFGRYTGPGQHVRPPARGNGHAVYGRGIIL